MGTTFALQTLDGGENPQNANEAGVEANLDTQYTVGVASGVPVTFISVGENTHDGAVCTSSHPVYETKYRWLS